jgi:hypothetical protein
VVKQLTVALALALFVVTPSAADVSGTWDVDGDVVGNPVKFACALKQDGETLSGTATVAGKEVTVKGSVKDRVVTFQFDVDYEGTTYTDVFTGTIGDDGTIAGTIAVAGVEGRFTAKKQKAKQAGAAESS